MARAFALDNLTLAGIRRLAAGWEARRLDAEEELAEIDLRRGRPDQVLDRLHTLAAAHPGRPRLAAALARALATTGRTDQARAVLAQAERADGRAGDGLHPALVQARRALSGSGGGSPPARPGPMASAAGVVPFQLPADTVRFTGRADYLARLLDLRPDRSGRSDGSAASAGSDGSNGPATVVVTAVEGMAGIGKTALAVRAAHRMADRFPDGVLFTDLRGFTPQAEPTAPEHALDHLLRGLGVPGPQIPPDLDTRIGLYRSVLARRQVLVLLDNVADETQLAPLLPTTPSCRTIVTSRRHLAGLDDATHLVLPVLDPAEAADLFRGLTGDRAKPADQPTIERIVALCGQLPLAIRIAAARLRLAPAGNPATACDELADAMATGSGLDWLSDGHRAVGAALAVSYRHLNANQQHAFRLAALHPGRCIEPYAMAALADATVDRARDLLEELHAASLIDQPAHRRYTLHDLVAAYASTLAAGLAEPDRQAAVDRVLDHYAAASSRAMNLAYPWEADHRPRPPATHTPAPGLTDEHEAHAWLDAETDSMLAAHTTPPPATEPTTSCTNPPPSAGTCGSGATTVGRPCCTRRHWPRPSTPAITMPNKTHCSVSATSTTCMTGTPGYRVFRAGPRGRPPHPQPHGRTGRAQLPWPRLLHAGPVRASGRVFRAGPGRRPPDRQPPRRTGRVAGSWQGALHPGPVRASHRVSGAGPGRRPPDRQLPRGPERANRSRGRPLGTGPIRTSGRMLGAGLGRCPSDRQPNGRTRRAASSRRGPLFAGPVRASGRVFRGGPGQGSANR